MPTASRAAAAAVSLVVAGSALVGLTGCSGLLATDREYHFSRYGDAPKSGTRSFVLDDWVPRDAASIDAARTRDDTPEALLRFTSETDLATSPACTPSDSLAAVPTIAVSWWPSDGVATSGYSCGDWSVVADGSTVYAWRG
ncbi:hypothetical protein ACPEEZ_02540 [Frigoribacterium sp. 2-23]|uniref:hypothetical protein n=1 Tax=Frigoribacterium sp. 2-23 TaxID=3415006 RepID=UPI003C6F0831